ncbi:MAG: hypothetical protein GX456_18455 [Verrucomicrobia bacterium]|nr:hypothetical protein [Verrucomicrobiota bacterium]
MHLFQSRKSDDRSLTGWVRRRIAALPQGVGNCNGAGSAAVLGRINPTADRAPASITQIRRPIFHRLGAAKNRRAPTGRWKSQRQRERGRPRPHQPDERSCTCFNHANPTTDLWPAGCGEESPRSYRRVGNRNGAGSAAVLGRINPTTDRTLVSITLVLQPGIDQNHSTTLRIHSSPMARPINKAPTARSIPAWG